MADTLRSKIIRLAASMPQGSSQRKALLEVLAAGEWWAHALGGLSKISYGPFPSAAAAKKFLLDRDYDRDRGPFKRDPYTGGWVGDSHSIEQSPPSPGRKVITPR